jgi:hypothetical protein
MRFLRHLWVRILLGALGFVIAICSLIAYLVYPTFKSPPAPNFPAPQDGAEANRQDLKYLSTALHSVDRSFTPEAWGSFDRAVEGLSSRAGSLDNASLEMGVAKALALANNGHTNAFGVRLGLTLNSIPLRFGWFREGLFVLEADASHADLAAAKVLAVEGRTPTQIARLVHEYVGGVPAYSCALSPHYLESPAALHAMGVLASPTTASFSFQLADGRIVERTVAAEDVPVNGSPRITSLQAPFNIRIPLDLRLLHSPLRDLSPLPVPGETMHWTHVLAHAKSLPVTLQHPDLFYWRQYLDGGRILFLQLNFIYDSPGDAPLEAFLDQTLQEAKEAHPSFAIVDLRNNPGGDYLKITDFTRKLPARIPKNGKLFILTSGYTFSAAISTAARLKYFAGDRAVMVGEPVGDRGQMWAEAFSQIELPNSHLRVGYATKYHDWENGCAISDLFRCYLPNYFYGVPAGDLSPSVSAPWSFPDYVAGKDTAMEAALAQIHNEEQLR